MVVVVVGRVMVAIVSRAVHGVYIKCSTLPLPEDRARNTRVC